MKTKKVCEGKDHQYNPITLDGKCVECGGLDPIVASHTPTPWKLSQTGKFVMYSRPGTVINVCEASPEDSAFIIRAVNCHEYLVQMLEHVESCLKNEMPIDLGSIQQAIAKAEGR